MSTYAVVVGIVVFKNKVLLLKRSPTKKYSPNLWEFVAGFVKEGENAEQTALREVREETKLKGKIEMAGNVFEAQDKQARRVVIPFLIRVSSNKIRLSREHTEFRWILPKEIDKFKCVVKAKKDLKIVGLL